MRALSGVFSRRGLLSVAPPRPVVGLKRTDDTEGLFEELVELGERSRVIRPGVDKLSSHPHAEQPSRCAHCKKI